MFGINTWQILIILGIIILLFGTKKIRNLGPDLGGAIKGFRKAMNEETDKKQEQESSSTVANNTETNTIDSGSTKKHESNQ